MNKQDYQVLEKALDNAIEELCHYNEKKYDWRGSSWLIPRCPHRECRGILGQKCMSPRLVCMKCGKEFEIKTVWTPDGKT